MTMPALALPRVPLARSHVLLTAFAAIAWTVLLFEGAGLLPPIACLSPVADAPSRYWSEWRVFTGSPFFVGTMTAWSLMFAAMMLPLLAAPLASVATQSFPKRRAEAQVVFLSGYILVWVAIFSAMLALLIGVRSLGLAHAAIIQPALLGVAAWWQGTRWKHAALVACHRRFSVNAFGGRAAWDNAAYGARHALACAGSCWLLMLAMIFGHDFLPAMAIAALVVFVERYAKRPPVRFGQVMLGLTALAALAPAMAGR